MSIVLISIKPEYVEKIFCGIKKYEYRRSLAQRGVQKLVVYSTWPVKKIVGEVDVVDTMDLSPTGLWENTKRYAGISRKKYRDYFHGRDRAYAYVLGKSIRYRQEMELSDIGVKSAPQSFAYLSQEQYNLLSKEM